VDLSKTMGASLYWTGFHEFNVMRFLNRYLKADMTFVDVGANQGEFSLFAAKRLSSGKVLAFEPMSLFFDRLLYNVKLNNMSNIQCFKLGLSDKAGEVPIYFNADNALNHEGLASLFPLDQDDEQKEVITLSLLDEVMGGPSAPRIDFIKVDVEGSEWAVLKGSAQILRRYRPALMVELNEETAAKAGYKVTDMMSWLREFGYEPYEMKKHGLTPLTNREAFCNAVFLAGKP
ncbi:MAG: FkbM family methyltransferase, partial [Chryseosolibacter sp.]